MKPNNLIFCLILFSCGDISDNQKPNNIIEKKEFVQILIDVHLAEAKFDIYKTSNKERSEIELGLEYQEIFNNHNTNKAIFESSLTYYLENPDEIEEVYLKILDELILQREQLSHSERNHLQ